MKRVYKLIGVREDELFGRTVTVEFSKEYRGEEYSYVVGTFNAFSPGSFRMRILGKRLRTEISLPEGVWYYLFYTSNGFEIDEENRNRCTYRNPAYNFSSTVNICHVSWENGTLEDVVYHAPTPLYVLSTDRKTCIIRLRIKKYVKDLPRLEVRGMGKKRMKLIASDDLFNYYEILLPFKRIIEYSFIVGDKKYGPFTADVDAIMSLVRAPDWAYSLNFYQIMVDRFCPRSGRPDPLGHFGGNIRDLIEKLGYLRDLGINALYLTPIFESKTYHSYDVEDYYSVASKYGGNTALRELIDLARRDNIRVFLDGVFHHTSFFHKFFQDVIENGNMSRYYSWYRIIDEKRLKIFAKKVFKACYEERELYKMPDGEKLPYESFFSTWIMPRLNHDNPEVRTFVRNVIVFWIKNFKISGWRFDVAHGVHPKFWQDVLEDLMEKYYLFGEIMDDARLWIHRCFNGFMNYSLYKSLIEYFVYRKISSEQLLRNLMLLRAYYGPYELLTYNFLDNHDTSRFLGLLKGDVDKYLCALAFLYTYPGIPSILYGDEIGLMKVKALDEEQREPMIWDKKAWDIRILSSIQELIRLRNSRVALQRGMFVPINFRDDVLDYMRIYKKEKVRIIINYSEKTVLRSFRGKIIVLRRAKVLEEGLLELSPYSYAVIYM